MLQAPENRKILRCTVVGELLDVLKADDASVVPGNGGETRRRLMDSGDRLERRARPAGLESSGAHIIGTGHHRGGQKERAFQRDAAQLRPKAAFILRQGDLQMRLDFAVQPSHQGTDQDLAGTDAGFLARRGTVRAGIFLREERRRSFLVIKPETAEQAGGIELSAALGAGCVQTQGAPEHVGARDLPLPNDFRIVHCSFSLL